MKFLFVISLIFYALGAFFSLKPKVSYFLGFGGSVSAFITGCLALGHGTVFWKFSLLNHIMLSLAIDHLSAVFLIIASISWLALALYSVDYSKLYPQRRISLGFNYH